MEKKTDRMLLIRIAQMYYEQNMTQSQIAKELGIYRTTISRLLKKVKEDGIVRITINYGIAGDNIAAEQTLKKRFRLKEAIVVSVDRNQSGAVKLQAIGQACARLLAKIIKDGDVIGFSWGSSLAETVDALETSRRKGVVCVPLVGGSSGKLESRFHSNTICYQAALKLGAQSLMIDLPTIVEKKETRDDILRSSHFREIASMWEHLSVAVFGIGSMNITGRSTWHAFYGEETVKELGDRKAAGDICSRFFDEKGVPVQTSLSERTITIQLEKLKRARYAIGVAESLEKVPGIAGALRGGYINALVTTEETAAGIIKLTE
ncbi:sugar-binding transcriptional regulator [Sporolactobacillus putidus]|uniref:sugar-binding transcriptional regulator n=1 Tax=Sporolactobacillus putidus TaxID=492735 RepID=UPI0016661738|nr:sugar-binding transcriptional regulator [Sporolactobacillus putidus]